MSLPKLAFLGDEEIGDRALELLLEAPETDRRALMRWAAGEFRRFDLADPATEDPRRFVAEALWDNPMLGDWMRARGVYRTEVVSAEDFRDLVDRLTPAYGDG